MRDASSQSASRSSNLELMRVILMFLIVVHHSVVNSGVMNGWESNPGAPGSLVLVLLGMWGKTCINPFVLVTGYFMCKRSLSAKKSLKLLLQVAFWFIAVNAFLLVIGEEGPVDAAKALLTPVRDVNSNFIPSYLILYFSIPVINAYISATGRAGVAAAIALLLWSQTVIPSFLAAPSSFSEVAWYIALYLIGTWCRLWPFRWMRNRRAVSAGFLASTILSLLSVIIFYRVSLRFGLGWASSYFLVSDSGKVLALTTGLFCFLWFPGLRMPRVKAVNAAASTVFGVLLIHANCPAMRAWLWGDVLGIPSLYGCGGGAVAARVLLGALAVFACCSLLEAARSALVEGPTLNLALRIWSSSRVRRKLDLISNKFDMSNL